MAGTRSSVGVMRRAAHKAPRRRRFTVDEYYRMAEAGILHEDDRVELIEGELIEMSPIGSEHAGCVDALGTLFHERLGSLVHVRIQNPVRLSQRLEPEPDVALLRPRADRYRDSHPGAADILLLIEVADTSLAYDKRTKLRLYAREGVPETWIVDLGGSRVEAHRRPETGATRSQPRTFAETAWLRRRSQIWRSRWTRFLARAWPLSVTGRSSSAGPRRKSAPP